LTHASCFLRHCKCSTKSSDSQTVLGKYRKEGREKGHRDKRKGTKSGKKGRKKRYFGGYFSLIVDLNTDIDLIKEFWKKLMKMFSFKYFGYDEAK